MALTKKHQSFWPGQSSFNKLIYGYRYGAEKRDLQYDLSEQQMFDLFKGNCYYCDVPPQNEFLRTNAKVPFIYNGIDRINSSLGYIDGNVVSCCKQCNIAKHNYSVAEFRAWAERLYLKFNR